MSSRPQPHVLVAGLGVTLLGLLLVLDAAGALTLRLGWTAPVLLAVVGATVLTAGLTRR